MINTYSKVQFAKSPSCFRRTGKTHENRGEWVKEKARERQRCDLSPRTLVIFPLHLRTQKRSFYPCDKFITNRRNIFVCVNGGGKITSVRGLQIAPLGGDRLDKCTIFLFTVELFHRCTFRSCESVLCCKSVIKEYCHFIYFIYCDIIYYIYCD